MARAIRAILLLPSDRWECVYNVGTGERGTATLLDIAKMVCAIGTEKYKLPHVEILLEERDIVMHVGIDITRIAATG